MKLFKPAFALGGALFLSACMPLTSSQPPPAIYTLHGPETRQQLTKNSPQVIVIREPQVPAGFDTNKIALYLYNKRRLDYYANAAWPEHLGKVLQEAVMQQARGLPDVLAVNPDSGIPAAYELQIEVNDFEPVYAADADGEPLLKASLSFRFLSAESRKTLLETTLSATTPATDNTRTAIVSGLEALLRNINTRAFREIQRVLKRNPNIRA